MHTFSSAHLPTHSHAHTPIPLAHKNSGTFCSLPRATLTLDWEKPACPTSRAACHGEEFGGWTRRTTSAFCSCVYWMLAVPILQSLALQGTGLFPGLLKIPSPSLDTPLPCASLAQPPAAPSSSGSSSASVTPSPASQSPTISAPQSGLVACESPPPPEPAFFPTAPILLSASPLALNGNHVKTPP